MKLHLTAPRDALAITGYGSGWVSIGGTRYARSVVVFGERVLEWPVAGFDALNAAQFAFLAGLGAEIVLLGTGDRLRFPQAVHLAVFARGGIGFEAMDTRAACRTYNILAAEGRRVAAALLL